MVSSPPVQGNPARAAFPLPQGPRSGPGRPGRDGKGSGSGHLFGQAQAAQDEAPHLAHFRAHGLHLIELLQIYITENVHIMYQNRPMRIKEEQEIWLQELHIAYINADLKLL